MSRDETRVKGDLTKLEINAITDQLVTLREQIMDTGQRF